MIRVTIARPNVFDSYGVLMIQGQIYTVTNTVGIALIQSGQATDTDGSLVNPGVGLGVPGNIIFLNAAEIASPTAQMLKNITATYALNVAPYTRYRSNGTALV